MSFNDFIHKLQRNVNDGGRTIERGTLNTLSFYRDFRNGSPDINANGRRLLRRAGRNGFLAGPWQYSAAAPGRVPML